MAIRLTDKKLQIGYFLYEIVHHCNLECKGCDHCAPIAQEEYVELKTYKKDIEKMKKIFHRINSFAIMGGEPLLHPKIIDIMKENDGLNIHKKLNQEEITEYFEKPIPFCKYCNMSEREENKEWGISKKEITEWT